MQVLYNGAELIRTMSLHTSRRDGMQGNNRYRYAPENMSQYKYCTVMHASCIACISRGKCAAAGIKTVCRGQMIDWYLVHTQ